MDVTDLPIRLENMYNRKSKTYVEHKIFPYATTEDLLLDLMDKVRNLTKSKNPDRYDDRLQVTTNLIEVYGLLMEFLGNDIMRLIRSEKYRVELEVGK